MMWYVKQIAENLFGLWDDQSISNQNLQIMIEFS